MRNPSYADAFRRIIDYVHHTPIANSDAPLIFVVFKLLAAGRPGIMGQGFQLANRSRQNVVRQRFEFFPRGRLYVDSVIIHAAGRVLGGLL